MSFPTGYNPNLVKIGFCPGGWQSQPGDQLKIEFSETHREVDPTNIMIEWHCIDCNATWEHKFGDQVDFDDWVEWKPRFGDQVDFDFKCEVDEPTECLSLWKEYPGDSVPVRFWKPWETFSGDSVPVTFSCDGDAPPTPEFTFFSGYFDADEGAELNFDITPTWITPFWTGEEATFKLNDFAEETFGDIVGHDGEFVGGLRCYPDTIEYKPVALIETASSGWLGEIDNDTKTIVHRNNGTMVSAGSFQYQGHNVGFSESFETSSLDAFQISFNNQLDNAGANDLQYQVGLYFNKNDSSGIASTQNNHFNAFSYTANPPAVWAQIWTPTGSTPSRVQFFYRVGGAQLSSGAVQVPNGINCFDGGRITFRIGRTATNALTVQLWYNDTLCHQETFGTVVFPNSVLPAWWYNYRNNSTATVTVSDIELGHCSDFLTTFPVGGLGLVQNLTGESASLSLATLHSFPFNFYTGENATAYLSSDTVLDNVTFFAGEYSRVDLTTRPPAELTAFAYTGEHSAVTLRTSVVLDPRAHTGESLDVVVESRPQPEMLLEFYDGETSQFTLSVPPNLGLITAYTGEHASVVAMDNAEFWRFYDGASAQLALATDTTLPARAYAGETAQFDLYIRPSEGIGLFEAATGEWVDIVVQVYPAVYLYPNTISTRTEFICEFDIATTFDMLVTTCCPEIDTHERIELDAGPPPDEHYHGDKTIVQFDLSTRARFEIDFTTGENFRGIDPNYMPAIAFYEGHVPTITTLDFEFIDFRLCYGNFIPNPENTMIELVSVYDDDCAVDFAYHGESMEIELENNVQLDLNMYVGEMFPFDIHVDRIMLLRAYHGEHARISNPEFEIRAYDGNDVIFDFYEEGWPIYVGEEMTIPTLTVEYQVEFLERGCLDNEFVPSDENGDPDLEKFNPVPIELEFYTHSIKARCY